MNMILCLIFLIQSDSSEVYAIEGTVVTATKMEEPIEHIGKCMTIITREEIEKDGASTVFEILRNFPGIHFVQKGPFGGVTQLHLRGTEPGHTLVLIDGIKVNDPTSPDRSFDWGTLPTVAIERIEVIRGPQSALYGSDAISGVINIITKSGKKGMKFEGSLSAGSYGTFEEKGGVSGGAGIFDYSLSLFNISSKGLSKAIVREGEPEKDAYKNRGVYTKLNIHPFNNLSMGLMIGTRDAKIDIDDGQFKDDLNAQAFFTSTYGKLSLKHKLTGLWHHKLTLGMNKVERSHEDKMDEIDTTEWSDYYDGEYLNVEWQNDVTLHKFFRAIAGFEYAKESAESWCDCPGHFHVVPREPIFNRSFYIGLEPSYHNVFLNFNGRIDSYEKFGALKTGQASVSWLVNSTRFKANYGTGFKTPTIYQLFHPRYGNPELEPEECFGYDVSGEHRFKDGIIEITYFDKWIFKKIVKFPGKYENMNREDKWSTEGLELNFLLFLLEDLRMDIEYSGVEKRVSEIDYLRIPAHNYRWGINYKWVNLKFCCIGTRWDEDFTIFPPKLEILNSCRKIDLTFSHKFKKMKLQARIENLIDEDYMETFGFSIPGRSFYIGISY